MKSRYIAVVDYKMGNLMSVKKALESVYGNVCVTQNKNKISNAAAIVLPGVGAFKDAMSNLNKLNLIKAVKDAIKSGKPFLGICLGLQMLFTKSLENGPVEGLDIIKGIVKIFPDRKNLKVPQIGWNTVDIKKRKPYFSGVKTGSYVYFVHSYYGEPEDRTVISSETYYGIKFASSICRDNIFATQFHPEKSQKVGIQILKNYVRLI